MRMDDFLNAVQARLESSAPDLIPLFSVMAQEARFGRAWIETDLKSLPKDARVLEVGGGVMLLSCQLALEGYDVTAIEPTGEGFGGFEKLRGQVLDVAKSLGKIPVVHDCTAESFTTDTGYDFAFSVNVMEHVGDAEAAINAVSRSLNKNGSYRFLCPNYLFPYEPHFNIPTFFSKSLTEKLLSARIHKNSSVDDPAGVWNSLNWISVPKVRKIAAKLKDTSLSFRKDTLSWMMLRVIKDETFASRRAKWMVAAIKAFERLGILKLADFITPALQPVMDCRLTKKS